MGPEEFDIVASAAGKVFLSGGYAVLEKGNVGYVTSINSRSHALISLTNSPTIDINVPQFGMHITGSVDQRSGTIDIDAPPELKLVITALELSNRYLRSQGIAISGLSIQTENDEAFAYNISNKTGKKLSKSGLGSSSAITVATIGGVLGVYGISDVEIIHKLGQVSHSLATGKRGSGFDIATATYGSMVYSRYDPIFITALGENFSNEQLARVIESRWDYVAERLPMPAEFKMLVANFEGRAMLSAEAIANVAQFKSRNPERYQEVITNINDATVEFVKLLKRISNGQGRETDLYGIRETIDIGRKWSRILGQESSVNVEPADCRELIERSNKHGALFSKLPGSGGYDSIVSVYRTSEEGDRIRDFWNAVRDEYGIAIKESIGASEVGFSAKKLKVVRH